MPNKTTKAKPTKSRLFNKNAPSRPSGASIPPGERSRSPRQAIRPKPTMTTTKKKPIRIGPSVDSEKACTDWITPERVRKVPRMVRAKVATESDRFQTRMSPRRSCTSTECRYAVPHSQGSRAAFSTGSHPQKPPQPSTWYDHHAPSTMPTERKVNDTRVQRRHSICQRSPIRPVASMPMAKANGTVNPTNPM